MSKFHVGGYELNEDDVLLVVTRDAEHTGKMTWCMDKITETATSLEKLRKAVNDAFDRIEAQNKEWQEDEQ